MLVRSPAGSSGRSIAFSLRFDPSQIGYWASRYSYPRETYVMDVLGPAARRLGYYTKPAFLELCRWKTPRSQSRAAANSEEFIREVTRTALATPGEQLRIQVLALLRTVSWPTASVLLHFSHHQQYPILDYRALWSLRSEVPPLYNFPFWWAYTQACRQLAEELGVSMWVLDRALWQYSKEHQAPPSLAEAPSLHSPNNPVG